MKTAWYLGHTANDIADRVILVGDPDRIDRIAAQMDAPRFLPVRRGLRTVTGRHGGTPVTAVSFGMGAPIATVVLHELAALGASSFIRIGTAMYFPPAEAGVFTLSKTVFSHEGTSISYVDDPNAQRACASLNAAARTVIADAGEKLVEGKFASFDAFYRDMFPLEPEREAPIAAQLGRLEVQGVIAADMETSALVNAAHALGVSFTSLCVGTVDGRTRQKLDTDTMAERETALFACALAALTRHSAKTREPA
ncbi:MULTISPECIES: uridine phosphorylase [unclassified Roseitalea]|uniref:phosphorylase family protein n=1 Tax=unclassified Roseitalea TaxID=2639107 RepID=UPI00273E7E7D|nr:MULTISPECIES: uridine phosphorylase [unclassified Roseitalea]